MREHIERMGRMIREEHPEISEEAAKALASWMLATNWLMAEGIHPDTLHNYIHVAVEQKS